MKIIKIITTSIILTLLLVSTLSFTTALTAQSVFAPTLNPGDTGRLELELSNNLEEDATEISIRLDFTGLPFNPVGSSEKSVDEIEEDKDEDFAFVIKAANDIIPGDYQIPYIVEFSSDGRQQTRQGSIGITVKSNPDLSFSLSANNPVIGQQGELVLRIINKGFADAKFLTLTIIPDSLSYTLLSEDEIYIGTVDSDDFETANFDVIFTNSDPVFTAIVEYKDFDNKLKTEVVDLPITVYSREKAIELGLIQKNNTPLIIGVVITIIVLWLLYRTIRKAIRRSKRKNSKE